MNRDMPAAFADRRMGIAILFFLSIPYVGLILYLATGMHDQSVTALIPEDWFLFSLFMLGSIVPALAVGFVLRGLIKRRNSFELRMLLEAYVCLILIFASGYAILQSSSAEPAVEGLTVLWPRGEALTFTEHVARLHRVYVDALYLSVTTLTTVGYGDLVPISPWARLLAALEGLSGVGFLGLALGHYFSVCLHDRDRHE